MPPLSCFAAIAGLILATQLAVGQQATPAAAKEDLGLEAQLRGIALTHHGKVTLFARNLKTGQTAALLPDELVKTASVIKLGVLLDAAEQVRAGKASLD